MPQLPVYVGRWARMETAFAVHHIDDEDVVVELHEAVTAPGPALELHVRQDAETGATIAWWEDEEGAWLGPATVGRA